MELRDNDLLLRHLKPEDAAILAELANNEKISRNLRNAFPHPYTLDHAGDFIKKYSEHTSIFVFAIEFKGNYTGNISLSVGSDVYCKSAEIGYFIGEKYWNKGIATRAVKLICRFGFENLDINRIYTGIYEYNPASMRVLEKCGFIQEGVFNKSVFKNNNYYDEHRYSLLKAKERKLLPGVVAPDENQIKEISEELQTGARCLFNMKKGTIIKLPGLEWEDDVDISLFKKEIILYLCKKLIYANSNTECR